jgi:transposase
LGIRTYISEPERGRRDWTEVPEAQRPVYPNRRRIRGQRGKRLLQRRGKSLERPCAHLYDTGDMRRAHLRGHRNILKRLLLHSAGFNLGLLLRRLIGFGTPRGLQGHWARVFADFGACACVMWLLWETAQRVCRAIPVILDREPSSAPEVMAVANVTCTTGC